ncbi:MAG: DUF1592 domain-containing protein [Polyangiaceae bacterium]
MRSLAHSGWLALTLVACSGSIVDQRNGGSSGASGSASTNSSGGVASTQGGTNSANGGASAQAGATQSVPATDPGRVTLHRLNRSEYNNTVRDLLGSKLRPADEFPLDDRGNGFDNMADVLSLSPLHLSSYLEAAKALVSEALANSAQRTLLVSCNLAQQGASCARSALSDFLPRAFRRAVTEAEVDHSMALVTLATTQGDSVEAGFGLALRAALISPNFLFRVERDSDPKSLTPHALTGYERASRLSYFLWSSMPDAQLLSAAANGSLDSDAGVAAQAARMLQDPKASALVENFAGQWLYIRSIDEVTPDATAFPKFDASLRAAEKAETSRLFQEIALAGLPADKLLTADFSFVNDRLAQHYGLPAVGSTSPVRVSLAGNAQRRGFLSHAGVLTVTSHPARTSPVVRGKWILNQLLCTDVPPPPPDVQTMLGETGVVSGATLRQRLEQHRADPQCSTCHSLMDPIGFGLENYDAIGAYRSSDNDAPIDSAGKLPDGRAFSGPVELAALIAADPNFPRCMSEKLYSYALGRGIDRSASHLDTSTVAKLSDTLKSSGFNFAQLVAQLVQSGPYLNRRGEP